MDDNIQGVRSNIEFPLGQDEYAVSQAIASLLDEGWSFRDLTKTHINICRVWEVNTNPEMQCASKEEKK